MKTLIIITRDLWKCQAGIQVWLASVWQWSEQIWMWKIKQIS